MQPNNEAFRRAAPIALPTFTEGHSLLPAIQAQSVSRMIWEAGYHRQHDIPLLSKILPGGMLHRQQIKEGLLRYDHGEHEDILLTEISYLSCHASSMAKVS